MPDDPLFDALRALADLPPDPRREARVRGTCHARIHRHVKHRRIATHVLHGATAAALCAYLASVLSSALIVALGTSAW
jgi:hypothetical protein